MLPRVLCWVGLLAFTHAGAHAAPPNLYDWLARAPVIVIAEHLESKGKFTEFRIDGVLKGEVTPGGLIRVRVRRANRDRNRDVDKEALRVEKGAPYVLLLVPTPTRKADAPPTFDLARGIHGVRELPVEGRQAVIHALERLIAIQDLKDDRIIWQQLTDLLDESDPLMIEAALEQFLKFRRGGVGLLDTLRPLLDHPSHVLRERTARLIGQILIERIAEAPPQAASLRDELIARARRDSAVPVRVAATQALAGLPWEAVRGSIEEIAREDPDQAVRYAAEKLIYDHRKGRSSDQARRSEGS